MVFYNEYQSYRRNNIKEHVVAGVNGLMNFKDISHNPNNWRFFIDSTELSLKTILPHNGNLLPSIVIGHFVPVKKTYANVKLILALIKYEDHK